MVYRGYWRDPYRLKLHHLNVNPKLKLVKKKKRNFTPEWNCLIEINVAKPGGKWRLCVDFTDLHRTFPKDPFRLPIYLSFRRQWCPIVSLHHVVKLRSFSFTSCTPAHRVVHCTKTLGRLVLSQFDSVSSEFFIFEPYISEITKATKMYQLFRIKARKLIKLKYKNI